VASFSPGFLASRGFLESNLKFLIKDPAKQTLKELHGLLTFFGSLMEICNDTGLIL
jgi:hypothetical protein